MPSPLDKLPPKLRRAPYTVEVDNPLVVGGDAIVTVSPVDDYSGEELLEVAVVCRSIEDGGLVAKVSETLEPEGGRVTLGIPADAPPTADGDGIAYAWTVRVRGVVSGREVALPAPVWVAPPGE